MYSLLTSAALFFILAPGVVITLPPGASPLIAGLVHAVVFYVIQAFVSQYVPWWAIWIVAGVVLIGKFYMSRSVSPTSTF
jgi:hypothetical protein